MKKRTSRAAQSHVCIESLENRSLLSASPVHAAATRAVTPSSVTIIRVSKPAILLGQDDKVAVNVRTRGGRAIGVVELFDNGTPIQAVNQPLEIALRGGHATYNFGPGYVALVTGHHALTAEYLGNGVVPASTSSAATVTVTQPPLMTAADGLETATVKRGSGGLAKAGRMVRVLYTGFLASNGQIFDYATANHGAGTTPYLQFTVKASPEQVIQGFDEGVLGMRVGEERAVFIPSQLGYGAQGAGSLIPPNSDIWFLVRLLAIH